MAELQLTYSPASPNVTTYTARGSENQSPSITLSLPSGPGSQENSLTDPLTHTLTELLLPSPLDLDFWQDLFKP